MMGFFAYIEQFYLGKLLATFLTAMLPVLELRASVPLGISLGLDYRLVFFLSVLGNMIPVPFIIVLITKIMDFLALRSARFAAFKTKLYSHAEGKWAKVKKWQLFGLFILVAIPLPGTGAWTGGLIAALIALDFKKAMAAIFFGVLASGIIVTLVCLGVGFFIA